MKRGLLAAGAVLLLVLVGFAIWLGSPAEARDPQIGWQGWVGSLVAVAGSLLVALVVFGLTRLAASEELAQAARLHASELAQAERLHTKTLEQRQSQHEQEMAAMRAAESARAVAAQELSFTERQVDAFAELLAALWAFRFGLGPHFEELEHEFQAVLIAFHRWRLVTPENDSGFADAVGVAVTHARFAALQAVDDAKGQADQVASRFVKHRGPELINDISAAGRRWFLEPASRDAVRAELEEKWPPL